MIDARRSVSVIVPVFDGERFLAEALESVFAQDHRPIEVIVVDDGSADRSSEIARSFPDVVVLRQGHRGIGVARNRGVERSTGAFLAFLDADDLFEPGRLSKQVAVLDGDPELEAVFGRASEFVDPGASEGVRASMRPPRRAFATRMVWTMLIRRTAFERVGGFTPGALVEAVDWSSRAVGVGLRWTMLDDVVLRRRLHGANTGLTNPAARRDLVRVARDAIDRRRAATSG